MNDFERNLRGIDLLEGVDDGLNRSLRVRLDDHAEDFARFGGEGFEEIFQSDHGTAFLVLVASLFSPFLGQGARVFVAFHHAEFQAGLRHAIHAEHLHGDRRPGFFQALALFVDQRADFAPKLAANQDIAHTQRSFSHEHRRDRAARFEAGFEDVAFGRAVGVRLQLLHVGLEHNHLEQFVDALFGQRGDVHKNGIAAPFLGCQSFVLQLLADFHRVRVGMVAFVDRDDDRDLGGLRVAQGFEGLWHDAIVGRDDQHDDVRHVRPAGAHRAECGVARRVEESNLLQLVLALGMRNGNRVGADVLRDAARLPGGDVRIADHIEQRGLAVVNMTHDGHYRCAQFQVFRTVPEISFHRLGRRVHDSRTALAFFNL